MASKLNPSPSREFSASKSASLSQLYSGMAKSIDGADHNLPVRNLKELLMAEEYINELYQKYCFEKKLVGISKRIMTNGT